MCGDFGGEREVLDAGGVHEKKLKWGIVAGLIGDHDVGGFAVSMLEAFAFE